MSSTDFGRILHSLTFKKLFGQCENILAFLKDILDCVKTASKKSEVVLFLLRVGNAATI